MEDSGSSPSGVTGEPVDTSGLSFTATYDDGTTGSVVPSSYTPTSFGDTAGTQTVTFSFEGTDITVDVDYDVEASSPVLTGLTCPDGFVNSQYTETAVDTTGMIFEGIWSNGDRNPVSPQSYTPTTWGDTVGTQTCTFSYTEDGVTVTCDVDADVQAASPTHVESLTASPDHFTTPQYYGDYPSASYSDFTFTAHFSDGTDEVVTPTYGNPPGYPEPFLKPKNLDVQDASFQYVDPNYPEYMATATVPTVVHRKEEQYINGGSTLIFDFQQEWMTDLNKGASDVITNGASDGELCLTIYDETSYTNDSTIDSTAYSNLLSTYNISTTESGTPNQLGYQPATGYNKGTTLSDCCVAYVATGRPNLYTDTTVYIVIAEADGAISAGGYKLSDFKSAGRVVYQVHVTGKKLITGVSIDDTDLPEQYVGSQINMSDVTATITFSDSSTDEFDCGELVDGGYGLVVTSTALDSDGVWTTSGTQSATFTVNDSPDSYWSSYGFDVASPAPSTTLTGITVQE